MKTLITIFTLFFINIKNIDAGCLNWFSECIGTCKQAKDMIEGENTGGNHIEININNTTPTVSPQHDDANVSASPRHNRLSSKNDLPDNTLIPPVHPRIQTYARTRSFSDQIITPSPKSPISIIQDEQNDSANNDELKFSKPQRQDSVYYVRHYHQSNTSPIYQNQTSDEIYFLHEQCLENKIKEALYKELPDYAKEKFTIDMSIRDFSNLCLEKVEKFREKANEPSGKKLKKYIAKVEQYQMILTQIHNIQSLFEKFSDNSLLFQQDRTKNYKNIQLISESSMKKYLDVALEKSTQEFSGILTNLEELHIIYKMTPPEKLEKLAFEKTPREFKSTLRASVNFRNSY